MLSLANDHDVLRVVGDQQCTPSYVPHVAKGVLELLMLGRRGIFHVVNNNSTTWHGFATELFRLAEKTNSVAEITTDEYPTAAERPLYSVLATEKFDSTTGSPLPDWKVGLREYVQARNAQNVGSGETKCIQYL